MGYTALTMAMDVSGVRVCVYSGYIRGVKRNSYVYEKSLNEDRGWGLNEDDRQEKRREDDDEKDDTVATSFLFRIAEELAHFAHGIIEFEVGSVDVLF